MILGQELIIFEYKFYSEPSVFNFQNHYKKLIEIVGCLQFVKRMCIQF